MQKLLSLGLALCLSLTLSMEAEAKRFGGGKSWGKAPTSQPMRRADSPAAAPAAAPAGAAAATAGRGAAASGASRWLGPLAGIAAGGLLAAMLFGDGFEGLQLMDILLFAGIAFLLFKLFASRRQAPSMAGAGQGMPQGMARQPVSDNLFGGSAAPERGAINAPAWFDEARFVAAGREHFMSLQQHWDANEMDKVAEFVTPQLFGYLRDERASLGEGYQATYIDNLQAHLDDVQQQGDTTVASLTFIGVSKTSRFDQGEPFSETWRMEREGDNAPWLIAGIRQN